MEREMLVKITYDGRPYVASDGSHRRADYNDLKDAILAIPHVKSIQIKNFD